MKTLKTSVTCFIINIKIKRHILMLQITFSILQTMLVINFEQNI